MTNSQIIYFIFLIVSMLTLMLRVRRKIYSKSSIEKISSAAIMGGFAITAIYFSTIIISTAHDYSAYYIAYSIAVMCLLSYSIAFANSKHADVILVVSIYTIIFEILYLKFNSDFSINIAAIGLLMNVFVIRQYSKEYRFHGLIMRSNDVVIDSLSDGYILLDETKTVIYKNQSARKILCNEYELNSFFDFFKSNIDKCDEFINIMYIIKSNDGDDDNDRYINVSYQYIKDEDIRYDCSYFILHDYTLSEKSNRKNEFIAKHHELTGLYNKSEFCEKSKVKTLNNKNESHILLMLDVDKFKMINELFGKETGDVILRNIADSIRNYTSDSCTFGHLNGDKFAVVMPYKEYDENEFFIAINENLRIEQDDDYKIIMHAGICDIDYDESETINVPLFIDRASLALSEIKGDMHKRTAKYGPQITKTIIEQQKIINGIDKALENKHICFFIQPQTDMYGNSFGGEALVRWIDPVLGIIPTADFVPVLEENGLISKVDLYVWESVCCKLKEWKDKGWSDYYLSVNISTKDMYYMNIYTEFTRLVNKYEISPSSLRLEVTESAVMMDKCRQFKLLEKLRKFGFMIEIDDFGSGYSSLNMLKDIEFDMLKIDMEFLRETEHVVKSRLILKSIIQMAKSIGTQVITEGVETEEQLKLLIEYGCFNFQGYYFDKPLEVREFEEKYIKN